MTSTVRQRERDTRDAPAATEYLTDMVRSLYRPWYSALLTAICVYLLFRLGTTVWTWGVERAVFLPGDGSACLASSGACWAAVESKWRLIVFGLYPAAQQWRPALWLCGFFTLLGISACPRCWSGWLIPAWVVAWALGLLLLSGIGLDLPRVDADQWGGLPLTLLIAIGGTVIALPAGILLALARQGRPGIVQTLSTAFIELMRGIPLVTILFFAAVVLPLFLPTNVAFPKVLRAIVATGACASGYVAEAVRGAIQAVSPGQTQSAYSLGLGFWQTQRYVVLPQALRVATPALINTFLAFFKSTSLVVVIGLYDLLGATRAALSDPIWQVAFVELYMFAGAIYFVMCFALSMYVRWLHVRSARWRTAVSARAHDAEANDSISVSLPTA